MSSFYLSWDNKTEGPGVSAHWPPTLQSLSGFCPSVSLMGTRLGRVCCLWSVSQCVCPVPLAFLAGRLRRQQKAPALGLYITILTSQVSVSSQWSHFCHHTFQASIGPGTRQAGDGGTQPAVLPFQNSPQQSCPQNPQHSCWEGTGLHAALLPCPQTISHPEGQALVTLEAKPHWESQFPSCSKGNNTACDNPKLAT